MTNINLYYYTSTSYLNCCKAYNNYVDTEKLEISNFSLLCSPCTILLDCLNIMPRICYEN